MDSSLLLMGALAAPAQATVRKGNGTDPSGDTPNAGNDVLAYAAQADDETGQVVVATGLAAPAATYVVALVGTRSGDVCGAPYVLFAGRPSNGVAVYGRDTATTGADIKPATIQVYGTTVALGANDPAR